MIRTRSRGYLLTWLGSFIGMVVGTVIPIAASSRLKCIGDALSCQTAGSLFIGVVTIVAVMVGIAVGVGLGPYVALRIARREFAGLTALALGAVVFAMFAVNSLIGPALEDQWLDTVWTIVLVGTTIGAPLLARYAALEIVRRLRKYQ